MNSIQSPTIIAFMKEASAQPSEQISQDNKEVDPNLEEVFYHELKYFLPFDKDSPQVAIELFKNIPKNLELNKVVDFIFKECIPHVSRIFIPSLLIAHPSFSLSPCDKIRKAIVEDTQHVLTNSSLFAMLKEHKIDNDEGKIADCYSLAYCSKHPYIYRLSQTVVLASKYTLNFLWVNLNPQDRIADSAQNIFNEGLDLSENSECIKNPKELRAFEEKEQSLKDEELENWKKIKKSFIYRISRWADANPNAEINLWYDSALVTQKAQQKTFEMVRGISQSRGVNLKLKDVRQLPTLDGETRNSLHPGTQVYYRVDLLKALIADHMISSPKESAKYCVVSDVDVEPMAPQQIFDQRTLDYLSTNGYVFNGVGLRNFENSFFIFNKEKEDLQRIHYKVIIQQAASNITELRKYLFRGENMLGAPSVFNLYGKFREEMREESWNRGPRKIVKCPKSQFNGGGNFSKSDYKAETFRFIGSSNIPYTRFGRNFDQWGYEDGEINALKNWKAEPLPAVE